MRIYISCVHSGPNPVAGLGIARSLRQAFPQVTLIGVDYASRSSGLHSEFFDEVQVQAAWDDLHLDSYGQQIRSILDDGAYWISSLDLETTWLRQTLGDHPRLIAPSSQALRAVVKPAMPASNPLPVNLPPAITHTEADWAWHNFCQQHGWKIFVKGPHYEAERIYDWSGLQRARADLAERWATDDVFAQALIAGNEESIAYAAHDGELLDAVYLRKRDITVEGKTWAADIRPIDEEWRQALAAVLRELRWTGGGELECVRDHHGALWLIDWNPRFPAWIHGATIAGHNLPGQLFAAVTGQNAQPAPAQSSAFTRIVLEIPTKAQLHLPPLPETSLLRQRNAKTPAAMPRLAQRTRQPRSQPRPRPSVPAPILDDLQQHVNTGEHIGDTPQRISLPRTGTETIRRFADWTAEASTAQVQVQAAYSLKTEPTSTLITQAKAQGLLVEAISQYEVGVALAHGFRLEQIVLNGPGKWWPSVAHRPAQFKQVFADSIEELIRYASDPPPRIGIRLRLPSSPSRFGILLEPFTEFQRLLTTLALFPPECTLALHVHQASSAVGERRWWQMYHALLRWGTTLHRLSGRAVTLIDIGGGWSPDAAEARLLPALRQAVHIAERHLPQLRHFLLEPGKALSQAASALLVRVLEVRQARGAGRDVVVDGALSDVPLAHQQPHRILAADDSGAWQPLHQGYDRILGRLCMEGDILAANVALPAPINVGDVLAICDVGAYDRSMAYAFGTG